MGQLRDWFELDGASPGERIRQNPVQLVVLLAGVWITALASYATLGRVMGDTWAVLVILLGAVAIGIQLQALLVPPD